MSDEKLIYNLDGGRLPYSLEAEQAVLGAILIDPKCLSEVAVSLNRDFFYLPQHKEIYSAMSSMYELSQTIDFVALLEKLSRKLSSRNDAKMTYIEKKVLEDMLRI